MAAAAILNLLPVSILVTWPVSGGNRFYYCQISQMCLNRWLRFAFCGKKIKMAASPILNYYLVILDHPRSLLVNPKLSIKLGVDRACTFQDIVILKFLQIWLKTPIQAPKITFLSVYPPSVVLRPQKALPGPETLVLSAHWLQYRTHGATGTGLRCPNTLSTDFGELYHDKVNMLVKCNIIREIQR